VSYDVTVAPIDSNAATVTGSAVVSLTNAAPPGLPQFVVDPFGGTPHPGDLKSYVSAYSTLDLVRARSDGASATFESEREFGRHVYASFVNLRRSAQTRLDLDLRGRVPLVGGWYVLQLLPQPTARADTFNATVRVPNGFEIAGADGCAITSARTCARTGALTQPE